MSTLVPGAARTYSPSSLMRPRQEKSRQNSTSARVDDVAHLGVVLAGLVHHYLLVAGHPGQEIGVVGRRHHRDVVALLAQVARQTQRRAQRVGVGLVVGGDENLSGLRQQLL